MQTGSVVYKLHSPSGEKLPATSVRFKPAADNTGLQNILLVSC